jgi:hypothetical protein
MKRDEKHRNQVTEYLDAMIAKNLSQGLGEMNKRAQAVKVQGGCRPSKSIVMR